MWEFAGVNMQGAEDWMHTPLVCLLTDLINHCHCHSILIYILFSTYLFQIVYVLNNNILDTIMTLMGIISIIITSISCPLPCPLTHLHTYSTSPALHPHRTPSHPPLHSSLLHSLPIHITLLTWCLLYTHVLVCTTHFLISSPHIVHMLAYLLIQKFTLQWPSLDHYMPNLHHLFDQSPFIRSC